MPDGIQGLVRKIARDLGLLALSAWLVWRPRTPYAADGLLFGEPLATR